MRIEGLGVDIPQNIEFKKISTDTRTIEQGDFYIPLKGANFDGEKFIQQAVDKGAIGYLTTGETNIPNAIGIKVPDTKIAYLELARFRRQKINPKVVLITGSSGKTTTKELVYSVISQQYKTFKTPLNHNNEIGFCQTIFEMPDDTEVLILEAGMRGLGEIELISKYALPDISIICNVGTAHIGRLGSRENIAIAKCEVTKYQNPNGVFIGHNDELIKQHLNFGGKKIFYSIGDTKVLSRKIGYSEFEYKNHNYKLNIEGDYNIENSLAAINAGLILGISEEKIAQGLESYKPIEKRWESEKVGRFDIINDSYNANPESMKAALKTIFELYPDSVIVLGDMGELGENEKIYHREVGKFIQENKTLNNIIITVGELAREIDSTNNFQTNIQVGQYIIENIKDSKTIFFKASRSMKFEEIINYIKENIK